LSVVSGQLYECKKYLSDSTDHRPLTTDHCLLKSYVTNNMLHAILVAVHIHNWMVSFARPLVPIRGHPWVVLKHHLKIPKLIARCRHLNMNVLRDTPLLTLTPRCTRITSRTNGVEFEMPGTVSFEKTKKPCIRFIHHSHARVVAVGVGLENRQHSAGDRFAGRIANCAARVQAIARFVLTYEADKFSARILPQNFPDML